MESDKENLNKWIDKTRIPLPVQPLPALPKHLLKSDQKRVPLRNLNSVDLVAGSSRSYGKFVPYKQNVQKQNTGGDKFVTLRQKNDDLDWELKLINDKNKDNEDSIITVSDDSFSEKENLGNVEAKRNNTPYKSPILEPNKFKNIKRSLKRPHSRELQGLSPLGPAGKKGDEKHKRRLKFDDNFRHLQPPEYSEELCRKCLHSDYANDMFEYLLSVETPGQVSILPTISRACVLNWLMKVNGPRGNPAVVQTACWYLDSVLCGRVVQVDQLQLVAAACFWIAQKIHGPIALASKLVKYSNRAFSCNQLRKTEMGILNRLKFPKQPIVPQDFITYLSWVSNKSCFGEIEIAATFLCMSALMIDKSFSTELPSVIAGACVRNALIALGDRESIQRLHSCPIFQEIQNKTENVCAICSRLRRAVGVVAENNFEYKAPIELFGAGPHYIAQKVIKFVKDTVTVNCT